MKIAILSSLALTDSEGGTERVAHMQALGLAALGHQVRLVTGRPAEFAGQPDQETSSDGLEQIALAASPEEAFQPDGRRPRLAQRIARDLRCFAPDAILVQNTWNLDHRTTSRLQEIAPVALCLHDFAGLCPRSFRTPPDCSITCPSALDLAWGDLQACARCVAPLAHGISEERLGGLLSNRLEVFLAEVVAAALILTPSRTHLVRLGDLIPLGQKARILPPGLCMSFPGEAPSPRAWSGRGPLRILHHGRRSVEKGTLDLVRALAMMPPGTVELIALGGAEEGLDQRLRAAAPEVSMTLGGPYDAAALEAAAVNAHLVALPSRLPESYSLAVDEGLALGLSVWASSADAAQERHGADVVQVLPAAEPAAWAASLQQVLDSPERLRAMASVVPESLPTVFEHAPRLADLLHEMVQLERSRRANAATAQRKRAS